MMVAGELENDVARDDAREELLELFGAEPDLGGKGVGLRHSAERELKGDLHWTTSVR
jgi:hypothetical protein